MIKSYSNHLRPHKSGKETAATYFGMRLCYKDTLVYLLIGASFLHSIKAHPCDRACDNSNPKTCEYDFTVEWYATMSKACFNCPNNASDCDKEHCIAADGFPRAGTFVNRKLPGPSITVCHNDRIVVRVRNMLENSEGTSIHWHGIYQRGTQWMDGVPMVTQCPIPAGTTFTYDFIANPPGTHWWHGHAGFHRSDGVAGALVIKRAPQNDPHSLLYDVDNENFTVMIGDWLHQTTLEKFIQHHHSDGSNKGESILINGRGQFTTFSNNTADYNELLTSFEVERDLRYRFRIINNAVVFCPFQLTIDQHIMTVIATDGLEVEPFNVTSLVLHGGERFDFILTANMRPSSYWFNVQGLADCKINFQRAILRYSTAENDTTPTSTPTLNVTEIELNSLHKQESSNVYYVTSLSSIVEQDKRLTGSPDEVYFIGFDFKKVDNHRFHDPDLYPIRALARNNHLYSPQLNNITFASSSSPLLTQFNEINSSQICNSATGTNVPNSEFRSCTHMINMKRDRLVELVIFDEGVIFDAGHPMHLHGQHFAVVAMERVSTNISLQEVKKIYDSGSIQYKLDKPVMKDSVIVPDGGYVVLRFITDNPGVWSFHCHLSFHLEAGMAMVFKVGNSDDVTEIPANFPKCGDWSRTSGNSASVLYHKLTLYSVVLHCFLLLSQLV